MKGLIGVIPIPLFRSWISQERDAQTNESTSVLPIPLLRSFLDQTASEARYRVIDMHDRDIVMKGLGWFEQILKTNPPTAGFGLARDVGEEPHRGELGHRVSENWLIGSVIPSGGGSWTKTLMRFGRACVARS